jgi:hypothetical protein
VEELEDEPDRPRPQRGQLAVRGAVDPRARELDRPGVGGVQAGEQVQEGRLARARPAGDRDELARLDAQVGAVEHAARGPAPAERLHHATGLDHRHLGPPR